MKSGKTFQNIKEILLEKQKQFDCYMVENCGMETEKNIFL